MVESAPDEMSTEKSVEGVTPPSPLTPYRVPFGAKVRPAMNSFVSPMSVHTPVPMLTVTRGLPLKAQRKLVSPRTA